MLIVSVENEIGSYSSVLAIKATSLNLVLKSMRNPEKKILIKGTYIYVSLLKKINVCSKE